MLGKTADSHTLELLVWRKGGKHGRFQCPTSVSKTNPAMHFAQSLGLKKRPHIAPAMGHRSQPHTTCTDRNEAVNTGHTKNYPKQDHSIKSFDRHVLAHQRLHWKGTAQKKASPHGRFCFCSLSPRGFILSTKKTTKHMVHGSGALCRL